MSERPSNDNAARDTTPTLFVGCGGTGYEVLIRIKAKVDELIPPGDRHKIRFLEFDTDTNHSPVANARGELVRFEDESAMVEIGAVPVRDIKKEKDKYPVIDSTFDLARLPSRDLRKGAKQVRQLGRLALFYHYTRVSQALESGIRQIISNTYSHGKIASINVVIVSSAAGGTGSGIVIDVAYLARHIAKSHGMEPSKVNILGYLALPEYFPKLALENSRQIRVNTFALLTEIDHFAHFEDFSATYPGSAAPVRDDLPPFSRLYLLDATNSNGRHVHGVHQLAPLLAEAIYLATLMPSGKTVDSQVDNNDPMAKDPQGSEHERYASLGVSAFSIQPGSLHAACSHLLAQSILKDGLLQKDSSLSRILQQGEPEDPKEWENRLWEIETLLSTSTLRYASGSFSPGKSRELPLSDPEDVIACLKQPLEIEPLNTGVSFSAPLQTIRIGDLHRSLFNSASPSRRVKDYCDRELAEALTKAKQHVINKKREIRVRLFKELSETCKSNVRLPASPIAIAQAHITLLKSNLNRCSRLLRARLRDVEQERAKARRDLDDRQREMERQLEGGGFWRRFSRAAREAIREYKDKNEKLANLELDRALHEEALALFGDYAREIERWDNAVNVLKGLLLGQLQETERKYESISSSWSSSFITEIRLDSTIQIEQTYRRYASQELSVHLSGLQKDEGMDAWIERIWSQDQDVDYRASSTMDQKISKWLMRYCDEQMKGILDESIVPWFFQSEGNRYGSVASDMVAAREIAENRISELYSMAAPLANLNTTRGGLESEGLIKHDVLGVPNIDDWQLSADKFKGTLVSARDGTRISCLRVIYGVYLELLNLYPDYALAFAQNFERNSGEDDAHGEYCFKIGKKHILLLRTIALSIGYGILVDMKDADGTVCLRFNDDMSKTTKRPLKAHSILETLWSNDRFAAKLKDRLTKYERSPNTPRVPTLRKCLDEGLLAEGGSLQGGHLLPVLRVFARARLDFLQQRGGSG